MADNTNTQTTLRQRLRDTSPYEIPLDDSVPEEFFEAAKAEVDGRMVEKIWDQFIEDLTEATVWDTGSLRDFLDEDTRELGEFWVIEATMRRFGFQFMGVPAEYRTELHRHMKPSAYDAVANDQEG